MTKTHDMLYNVAGHRGGTCCYRLRIYHGLAPTRPVVLLTQIEVHGGTSITHMAEELALQIWHEFLPAVPRHDGVRWVEHYPPHGRHYAHPTKGTVFEHAEDFDWVTFSAGRDRRSGHPTLVHPHWTRTDRAHLEAILGQRVE